jgi:hypothetical protein
MDLDAEGRAPAVSQAGSETNELHRSTAEDATSAAKGGKMLT